MKLGAGLGLFLVSAATLALEILQVLVFSYSLELLPAVTVISLALLGFGTAATLLALVPRRWIDRDNRDLPAAFTLAAAATVIPAHLLFALGHGPLDRLDGFTALAVLFALFVPYLLLGAVVTLVLRRSGKRIFGLYALNLAGSALGAWALFPLLRLVPAEGLVVGIGFFLALTVVLFGPAARGVRMGALLTGAAHLLLLPVAHKILPFPPKESGVLTELEARLREDRQALKLRESLWDPCGKVEVYEFPGLQASLPDRVECHLLVRNGEQIAPLLGTRRETAPARGLLERTLLATGYAALGRSPAPAGSLSGPDVLVLGLCGNLDLLTAQHYGARSVTAVEDNDCVTQLIGSTYRDFLGAPLEQPYVRTVATSPRDFLRSTRQRFDLIQMVALDPRQIARWDRLATRPDLMGTVEAFGEMLDALAPGGTLCLVRLGLFGLARGVLTASSALSRRQIKEPNHCIAALQQGEWTALLVRREPFTADETARLSSFSRLLGDRAESPDHLELPPLDLLRCGPQGPIVALHLPTAGDWTSTLLRKLLESSGNADSQSLALRPVTDDRPFFFDPSRRRDLLSSPLPTRARHLESLAGLLVQIALLATAFLLLPVAILRREPHAPLRTFGAGFVYFAALGAGFIVLELGFLQKFLLFLGDTVYSVALVLFALLATAGLGSLVAPMFGREPVTRVRRASFAAAGVVVLWSVLLDPVFALCAGMPFSARVAISVVLLMPAGLALGIPMPTALHAVTEREPDLVPWVFGLNGFFSVIGSVACLPFSMLFGFRAALWLGAALYLLPPLVVRTLLPQRPQPPAPPAGGDPRDGILPGTYAGWLESQGRTAR